MPGLYTRLRVDRPRPHVLRVLIDRPDKRNAIDSDVRQQLIEVFASLPTVGDIRAIVIGGVDGHFSAGGDLPSMVGLSDAQAHARMQHIAILCNSIHNSPIPVVTAMEGFSAGACVGLALLGDYIVVGEDATILFPFMKLGLVPDWGMLYTLPQRVGLPVARRILVSGEALSGTRAGQLALADEVVADAEVMGTALHRAVEYSVLPRRALACMKRRLARPSSSLVEELEREERDQAALLLGVEFYEGYTAFTEKRAANFLPESGDAS